MSFEVNLGPRHLFAIHLLTASGAAFALLAIMAIADRNWTEAFVWLGVALVVDGIDGPIARRYRVRERLPKWDGAALDFVIDYATYVFAPAIVISRALALPPLVGDTCGMLIAVTGALYFADTRMKAPDNSFRGFPAVWNMAAFVLYAFLPPPPITVGIVVLFAALTFLPVNFVHPLRVAPLARIDRIGACDMARHGNLALCNRFLGAACRQPRAACGDDLPAQRRRRAAVSESRLRGLRSGDA